MENSLFSALLNQFVDEKYTQSYCESWAFSIRSIAVCSLHIKSDKIVYFLWIFEILKGRWIASDPQIGNVSVCVCMCECAGVAISKDRL